jgi:hypothetical protein
MSLKTFLAEKPQVDKALEEAKYIAAAEFHDDFYSLLNTVKATAATINSKKAKLRNWLRRSDFANETEADEMFDTFLAKFNTALDALKATDTQLQKKLS